MSKVKFFICRHCGNIIEKVSDSGVPVFCCGQKMEELVPNTVEASVEKHIPVVSAEGDVIRAFVGSAEHPMVPEHFIQWIYLQTEKGGQRKDLQPGEAPEAVFSVTKEDRPVAVYAYCNLHGLWVKEL